MDNSKLLPPQLPKWDFETDDEKHSGELAAAMEIERLAARTFRDSLFWQDSTSRDRAMRDYDTARVNVDKLKLKAKF